MVLLALNRLANSMVKAGQMTPKQHAIVSGLAEARFGLKFMKFFRQYYNDVYKEIIAKDVFEDKE